MAKCEKCGQDNAADATSCTWCGTPLVPVVDPNSIPNRDLGQLISHTFHLYGKNFWQFILIGLPPQILGFVTLLAFPDIGPDFSYGFGSEAASEAAIEEFAGFTRVFVPISILSALAVLIVEAATIHAVGKQYLGQNIDVLASLRRGLSKILILIAVSILMMLALMVTAPLMLILIGIPLAIFLVISWAFVFQMVMIEGKGPISALGSSFNLVKGSRLRVLGIGIVFILIQIGLQILITIATGAIDDVSQPLATITSSVALAVISPIMFIGLTVVYLDLRARKEGLTLDTLAMEMGERVSGAASSDDLRDM
jgi:hypothetical protein